MTCCDISIPKALCLFAAILYFPLAGFSQTTTASPESVVVVANKSVDGSLRVAKGYLKRRSIPEQNLIILETAETEKISRTDYLDTIHNPILAELLDRGLVEAIEGQMDPFGRRTVTILSNPIQYLVLCYGVPVHISNLPLEQVDDLALREKHFSDGKMANLVKAFSDGPMARNEASVDSELSLLLQRDIPLNGFVPNPYYNNRQPSTVRDILKVTRLDGPSPGAVLRMLDNALEGERKGLKGRAYVDQDGRGGGYQMGNDWLANTTRVFQLLGYDLDVNTERGTIAADDRIEAPVLYAGWYAWNVNAPFTLPGFRFPPGAVAAHLHSFSAAPLRSDTKGWVGPLVNRGVSATFGNTAEPYLRFTHQFDHFFAALAEGWAFGDAAYFALAGLSWQNVSIGDPLYRPFAVSLEDQLAEIGNPLDILSDQYVLLRQINLLEAEGRTEDALRLANRGMRETPGPALGLKRAGLLAASGDTTAAREGLSFLAQLDPADAMDWGLFAEMADALLQYGDPAAAFRIYQKLEKIAMPEAVQLAFLKRGIQAADQAGKPGIAIEWRARVTPPPPPEKTDSMPRSGK